MLKSLTPMTVAALLTCAAPVIAQDAAAPVDNTAPAAQTTEQAAPAPAQADPRQGGQYIKEKNGDWTVACVKVEQAEDHCSTGLTILDPQSVPIAEFSVFRIDRDDNPVVAGATAVVPLEVALQGGFQVSIDGAPAKRYQYSYCNSVGCIAEFGLTQADVDALKKGNEATLVVFPLVNQGKPLRINMSLSGFTASYNTLRARG